MQPSASNGGLTQSGPMVRDVLPPNDLFTTLLTHEYIQLTSITRTLPIPAGEVLTRQGQPIENVYFIREGRARAELSDVSASTGPALAVVSFLGPGSDIGLISILDGAPHSATVRAVEPLSVAAVPASAMTNLLDRHPEWYVTLAHIAVRRLRISGGWLEKLL